MAKGNVGETIKKDEAVGDALKAGPCGGPCGEDVGDCDDVDA